LIPKCRRKETRMVFAVVTSHSMEKIEDISNEQYHATWKT